MPSSIAAPHPLPERLHGLDALRGFALILGVALHACMSYLPDAQYLWIVNDGHPSLALSVLFYFIHLFRITLFFVIAGFFGRLAYHRLGLRGFARDRWRRIAVPLLVGWPPLFAAIVAAIVWGAWLKSGGHLAQEASPGPAFTPSDFPLTHLWFLYVLCGFYVVTVALRGAFARLDPFGLLRAHIDTAVGALSRPGYAVLLALPLAACLWMQPGWLLWFGVPTPDHSLYPNLPACVGYGVAFGFGWLLQRQPDLLSRIQAHWQAHLLVALITTAACLFLTGPTPVLSPEPDSLVRGAYALAYASAGWAWTFALFGIALRFMGRASPVRRYLADASYWIYLVHLPIVMALQVIAAQLDAPWWIEFPVLLGMAFAVMLATYHAFVRHSFIGRTLNGRRMPRHRKRPMPMADVS
ncbi:MAG: acyltransferase family protein [Tahibacter sp.]